MDRTKISGGLSCSHSTALSLLAIFATALAGCGSGADDASSTLSVTPTSLSFAGASGDTAEPPPQTIAISASGSAYISTEYAGTAYEAAPMVINGNTATATVRVPAPVHMGAGVHLGTVTVRGYEFNYPGSPEISGSPKYVGVTYSIPGIAASPSHRVSLNQTSGGPLPQPKSVTISDAFSASYGWTTTIEYGEIIGLPLFDNWLEVTPTSDSTLPSTVSLTVVRQGQAGIEYQAYVDVTSTADPVVTLRLHVTYRAG